LAIVVKYIARKKKVAQTAAVMNDMNLHPHAVLNRVLWRWYQSPFGL
jgi:hypothetical protein